MTRCPPSALQTAALDFVEIGHPPAVLAQHVIDADAPGDRHRRTVGRIAGIGHQHAVAFVEIGHTDVHHALFRPDQRKNLALRIERDAVALLIPKRERLAQHGRALVRLIAVIAGLGGLGGQRSDHVRMGRPVGTADTQIDDLTARGAHPVDFAQLFREIVLSHSAESPGQFHFDRFHLLSFFNRSHCPLRYTPYTCNSLVTDRIRSITRL